MNRAKISTKDRVVTAAALERATKSGIPSAAIELSDGKIITSETSDLLGISAALLLNAVKYLAGIPHSEHLIPAEMIEPIQNMKVNYLRGKNPRLHTDEVLVALAMLSLNKEKAHMAIEQLPKLKGCQVHTTELLSEVDRKIFKKLGIDFTSEPIKKKAKSL